MTNPPPTKSLTAGTTPPRAAGPAGPGTAVGEPTGAARQGVVTALRSRRSAARPGPDPTPDAPGIRIFAPPVYRHPDDGVRWSTRTGALPTAAYACACGLTGTATGPEAVAALAAEYDTHRSTCTGAPAPITEGRAAA